MDSRRASYQYSNTWQLVINTGTTIVTFLMVFLIQNTQNRDARAIHLKLDEIIRAIDPAQNEMIDIEKLSDEELEAWSVKFEAIRRECESRKQQAKETLVVAASATHRITKVLLGLTSEPLELVFGDGLATDVAAKNSSRS
ncbi:MAG TPA: low affinity iron permease family protein [Candidatus Sulfotelmatobacter sp.]